MKKCFTWIVIAMLVFSLILSSFGCVPATPPVTEEVAEQPAVAEEEAAEPLTEPTKAEEPTKPPEPVTITFWHVYGPEMAGANSWFNDSIAAFEKEHPNIKIEQEITPNDQYKPKLKTAIAAGEAADAFMVYAGAWTEPYAKEGAILAIDQYLDQDNWRDNWISGGLDMLSWDGKTYGVTAAMRTTHIWYNKDVFAKYNLQPVQTWDELVAMAQTLKDNGVTPFAMGNKERWQGDFWAIYLFTRIGGWEAWQRAMNRTGQGWADPANVQALQMLQDFAKSGYFTEGTNGVGAMDVNNSFFTGEAAMILNGTFFIDQVKSLAPEGFADNTLGYFNFPIVEGGLGAATEFQGATAAAFVINSKTKYPDEIIEFYRFLFAPENVKELMARTGWISTIKNTIPDTATPLQVSIANDAAGMTHLYPFADSALVPAAFEVYADAVQAIIGGEITPEEAVAKIEEAVSKEVGPLK